MGGRSDVIMLGHMTVALLLLLPRCQGREVVLDMYWWHYPPYIQQVDAQNRTNYTGLFTAATDVILQRCRHRLRRLHNVTLTERSHRVVNPRDCLQELGRGTARGQVLLCLPYTRSPERVNTAVPERDLQAQADSLFIPLLESPGAVHFYVKSLKPVGNDLLVVIAQGWPMLVLILLGAAYSGIIIWALDRLWNPENFPKPFIRGFWEGFWWAFVTMTTVGYGDTTPRSLQARMFGLVWIVVGVAILSVFTATVTTVLTQESLGRRLEIQGVNVLVLNGSKEYEIAVSKGTRPIVMPTFEAMLTTLSQHDHQGALVENAFQDQYSFSAQQTLLNPDTMLIDKLISYPMVHGALVSAEHEPAVGQCLQQEATLGRGAIVQHLTDWIIPLTTRTTSALESARSLFQPQTVRYMGLAAIGWVCLFVGLIIWEFCYWRPKHRKRQEIKRKSQGAVSTITDHHCGGASRRSHHGNHSRYVCPCSCCSKYDKVDSPGVKVSPEVVPEPKEQNNVIRNDLSGGGASKAGKNLLQIQPQTVTSPQSVTSQNHMPPPRVLQSSFLQSGSLHARWYPLRRDDVTADMTSSRPPRWPGNPPGESLEEDALESLMTSQHEELAALEEDFAKFRRQWEDRLREVLDAHAQERAQLAQGAPPSRSRGTQCEHNLGYHDDDDAATESQRL